MSDVYSLSVNPFEDDAVEEPRSVTFSVEGLNTKPLNRLLEKFERLKAGSLPRSPIPASQAQLVVSPEPGFGKSHLLGRLFLKLGEEATQIYLRPFQDHERAWHSILLTTVQELGRPSQHGNYGGTQLEAFAMGVLVHVAVDFMEDGGLNNYASVKKEVEYLRSHPLEVLKPGLPNKALMDWLRARLENLGDLVRLANLLNRRGIHLGGREKAWLRVLGGYAFQKDGSIERDAALTWLRGERLEDEQAESLKLMPSDNDGAAEASATQINQLSLARLNGLCTLSSYYRPFLFCFDQTEVYGSDRALAAELGQCIWRLVAALPNHQTIVTTNATNWTADIVPHMAPANLARFSPPLQLEGINEEQASELLSERLKEFQLPETFIGNFIEPCWLGAHFDTQPTLSVRHLLRSAAERFRKLGNPDLPTKATIEALFATELSRVHVTPAMQQYNQDSLMWFAQVLIQGFEGVEVTRTRHKYFSTRWAWNNRSVYFAFEGGHHNATWRAIANEAMKLAAIEKLIVIVFRTPDLKEIPGPRWAAVRQTIEQARQKGLRIVSLRLEEVCALHAAREFYCNALQGDVDYAPQDVLNWLREKFVPWFNRFSSGEAEPETTRVEPDRSDHPTKSTAGAPKELTKHQSTQLMQIVREMMLVDINVVLERLGQQSLREALLRAVERSPNLKAHPGPQTTYLQWRITA